MKTHINHSKNIEKNGTRKKIKSLTIMTSALLFLLLSNLNAYSQQAKKGTKKGTKQIEKITPAQKTQKNQILEIEFLEYNSPFHQTIINTNIEVILKKYGPKIGMNIFRQHFLIEINYQRALINQRKKGKDPLGYFCDVDSLNKDAQKKAEEMYEENQKNAKDKTSLFTNTCPIHSTIKNLANARIIDGKLIGKYCDYGIGIGYYKGYSELITIYCNYKGEIIKEDPAFWLTTEFIIKYDKDINLKNETGKKLNGPWLLLQFSTNAKNEKDGSVSFNRSFSNITETTAKFKYKNCINKDLTENEIDERYMKKGLGENTSKTPLFIIENEEELKEIIDFFVDGKYTDEKTISKNIKILLKYQAKEGMKRRAQKYELTK